MSGEALGWALPQRTGDPTSKSVLLILALDSNADGAINAVDIPYLADRVEISERTLFRALGRLQEIGALERKVTFGPSGRRKLFAQLCLGTPIAVAGAAVRRDRDAPGEPADPTEAGLDFGDECASSSLAAVQRDDVLAGKAPESSEADLDRECASPGEGPELTSATTGTDNMAVPVKAELPYLQSGTDKMAVPSLCSNIGSKYTPLTPHAVGEAREGLGEESELVEFVDRFLAIYPIDATMSRAKVERAAAGVSPQDRQRALSGAARYADAMTKRGSTRPTDAARWLRDRHFDDLAVPGASAANVQLQFGAGLVFVMAGTPAWNAWLAAKGKRSMATTRHRETHKEGWYFPSLFPPKAVAGAA